MMHIFIEVISPLAREIKYSCSNKAALFAPMQRMEPGGNGSSRKLFSTKFFFVITNMNYSIQVLLKEQRL